MGLSEGVVQGTDRSAKDEVFLRVGDENRKLSFRQRQQLLYDKGQAVFESEPVSDAHVEDLDSELLEEYARGNGSSRRRTAHVRQEPSDAKG